MWRATRACRPRRALPTYAYQPRESSTGPRLPTAIVSRRGTQVATTYRRDGGASGPPSLILRAGGCPPTRRAARLAARAVVGAAAAHRQTADGRAAHATGLAGALVDVEDLLKVAALAGGVDEALHRRTLVLDAELERGDDGRVQPLRLTRAYVAGRRAAGAGRP